MPLIKTDMLVLSHYAEYSQIVDKNYGVIFPGFYAKFWILNLNLEYRTYEDDYMAGYIDIYGKDNNEGTKSLTGIASIDTKIIPKLKNMEFQF